MVLQADRSGGGGGKGETKFRGVHSIDSFLRDMLRKIVDLITSLKLTIVCLAAAMALIFAGTLAQVHLGIHEAQQRYFQSFFVWWPPEGRGFKFPIFPGGHLIGAVLLVNLIAAHAKRFRWAWRKLGIHLTHAGLIIMLAGGLFTDLFAVESHMRLANGETKNYSEDITPDELAVIDTTDPEFDQVTAIPESVLRHKRIIEHRVCRSGSWSGISIRTRA